MKGKSSLLLMEQLMMILVFALAAALCLQVFAKAGEISEETARRDQAVILARNAAELLKATDGDTETAKALGRDGYRVEIIPRNSGQPGLACAEIVSQREIAIDTRDYLSALRACVRQAPDVILLGEMRDPETMHTAMTAAETGHLVIATLHTRGAVNAIDRIIDSFPSTQQAQIRMQLSTVLRTVVSQQLLPDVHGGMIPACEILQMTGAVRSMIRDNKNHQIDNAIASGSREGMISMDQAIAKLCQEGKISQDTALHYADRPEQLKRQIM